MKATLKDEFLFVFSSLSLFLLIATFSKPALAAISESVTPESATFAFNLTRESLLAHKGNVLVSPVGAYIVLSMAAHGARGETKAEILRMLGSASIDELEMHSTRCVATLESHTKTLKLSIADAIFADTHCPLLNDFSVRIAKEYKGEISNLPFRDPATVGKINGWVSNNTKGCIPKIIDSIDGVDVVLINAVYFKGRWAEPFSKAATRQEIFQPEHGGKKNVQMMHQTGSMQYFEGFHFQALSLPYAGDKQSLFVLLPYPQTDARKLAANLDRRLWSQIVANMNSEQVNLTLPKFKFSFEQKLNAPLQKLGMRSAFSPQTADFGLLCENATCVDTVFQRTFIDVNEEGTEAAAVTALCTVSCGSSMPSPPIAFKADRPFIIALRDNVSGEFLFIGLISEP